ncbi:MAG: SWIM zinc finger family protein, partial [Proteiniphilum sp.]|nr:SWIM zinc finger family protein [Proteiniphilum sp.]
MKIDKLKQYVPGKIYQRGKEYYENDLIENVEHEFPDKWSCEVEGSDIYLVSVDINGDEVLSWECDCPYDQGYICKHVVAFLIYIQEHKEEYPVEEIFENNTPLNNHSLELLNNMGAKEMHKFIKEYSKKNPEFMKYVEEYFLEETGDYEKEISDCFRIRKRDLSYNRYGYSGEEGVIAGRISNLIDKNRLQVKNGRYKIAVKTVLSVMEEIGDCYEEYQDYDGELASACSEAADFLAEIIEGHDLSPDLLSYITDELGRLLKNNSYDNYSLADIDSLLMIVSVKSADNETALKLLDEALNVNPDSFRTHSLVKSKLEILNNLNRKKNVEEVITQYLYLPEIRKIRLEELLQQKRYDQAIQLIDEGIKLAEEKGNSGTVIDWKDEKLQIYIKTNNIQNIIHAAEDLFENGRESMKYFHILKQTIPFQNWDDYLQKILSRVMDSRYFGVLDKIYIEEKQWEKLMDWTEEHCSIDHYDSMKNYKYYLEPHYAERILEFYRSKIVIYAERNMGRSHYKTIASVLKEM